MQSVESALSSADWDLKLRILWARLQYLWDVFLHDHPNTGHWVVIGLWALLGVVVLAFMYARWRYWKRQGKYILEPGSIGPKPGLVARIIRYVLGRIAVRFMLGPVTIRGRRNLWYRGRLIAYGPHFAYADALLAVRMMKLRPVRYFIAREEAIGSRERVAKIKGVAGVVARFIESLRTPMLAYTGGIVVDRGNSRATAAALRAGIDAMDRDVDSSLIIFPEGKIRPQGQLIEANFFNGAVKLGKTVQPTKLRWWSLSFRRRPLAILPWAMVYVTDPAQATLTHRFIANVLGFKNFRRLNKDTVCYRVEVMFGTPVPVEELPDDLDEARHILYRRVERFRQYLVEQAYGEEASVEQRAGA